MEKNDNLNYVRIVAQNAAISQFCKVHEDAPMSLEFALGIRNMAKVMINNANEILEKITGGDKK